MIKEWAFSPLKSSKTRCGICCVLFIVGAYKARWVTDFDGCCLRLIQSLGRLGKNLTVLAAPWGRYPGLEASFYSSRISISVVKNRCGQRKPSAFTLIANAF